MKLGIISYDYDEMAFKRVSDFGLDFVEFCVNANEDDHYNDFASKANKIMEYSKKYDIPIGSVGRWGGNKILSFGAINPDELLADETLIKTASILKSPVFVTSCNYVEKLSLFENYSLAISYFTKLCEIGKEYNVKIATCNCRWNNFVHSDSAWSVIHGHVKDLYIKYDPSHCIYDNKENYLSEMNKWGDRFAHIHIKGSLNVDGQRIDDPPAGLDGTNWSAFMGMLFAKGYDGNLSIEPHSGIWKDELGERGIKHTIKFMRNLML